MPAAKNSRNKTVHTMLSFFALWAVVGCGKFSPSESAQTSAGDSNVSPWSLATQSSYSGDPAVLANMGPNSCSVSVVDSMKRDEVLRVTVSSKNIQEVQVSVDNGKYQDLGAVNGVLTWKGNTFAAATYLIRFRGIKTSDGSVVPCDPEQKNVTLLESSTAPRQTPLSDEVKRTFVSWHQSALRLAKMPAAGSYDYTFVYPTGFKNQYNPTEAVSGCTIGVLKNNECAFPGGLSDGSLTLAFSEDYTNYSVPENLRFFVPTGPNEVRLMGYAPQKTAFAFVMRMGEPPTRTAAVSSAEYSSIQSSENIGTSFQRLAKGEEVLVVHDGGGTLRLLSGKALASQGGWVFVRQLSVSGNVSGFTTGKTLYLLQGGIDADRAAFIKQYGELKWDANGDPQ